MIGALIVIDGGQAADHTMYVVYLHVFAYSLTTIVPIDK